jgi:hypothetical protein
VGRVNFGQVPTAARDTVRCGSGDAAARQHGMGRRAADGGRPTAGASRETKGVFDFTPPASLADEPGFGQPEPASNYASLMFDLFSHLRQVKTSICV